ncbi:MAG: hypothetical protein ACW98J_07915, partial [Candidatus Thorarchaeota archaeon]
ESPLITHPGNIEIWTNQTPYELEWDVNDMTPWNYSIYINDTLRFQGRWNADSIVYPFNLQTPGNWEVRLVVCDLFDNLASSAIIVTLKLAPSTILLTVLLTSGVMVIALVIVFLLKRRHEVVK